jgi:release factor glutamine methyltransferase
MRTSVNELLGTAAVRLSASSDTPGLDAQVLLAHVLGRRRTWLLAHSQAAPDVMQAEGFEALVRRVEAGEPLAYVVGHREFYGLDFEVTADVLIPRPETELLVERGIAWLTAGSGRRTIADIGTGCGCIAISLAVSVPTIRVLGTDVSLPALRVAARNARRHGVADRVDFLDCDLLPPRAEEDSARSRFDMLCANLPYVPSATLRELRVSRQEPTLALDGGEDGLAIIHRLLQVADGWMLPAGLMLLEIEASQGPRVLSLAHASFPEAAVELHQDLAGRDRLLAIRLRGR